MSWQPYVDEQLVGSGHLTAGAIFGLDGNLWAQSISFPKLSDEENEKLRNEFNDCTDLFGKGLSLGGVNYQYIKQESSRIHAKKGTKGMIARKTASLIIVGLYDTPARPANATIVVENLGDYLTEIGC